ncbi:hypothetical protein R6Q59_013936 [Mikania micrantha]|uniref:Myb-like domain-containing protein n=1 Tax=Mikania micrantha TaxID=192012 RepID=A0A5N6P7Y2_9ASTR|nr:hypothetical protein E3N88_12386 [Mikania micrantha]
MPHKSSGKEKRTMTVILRRSPRFQQIVTADSEDPKTPKLEQHRRTRSVSSATPISFTGVSPRRRSHRSNSKECSQKFDESCNPRRRSVNSKKLNSRVNECNAKQLTRSSDRRNGKLEKRVTRSSCCRDLDKTSHGCSSGEWILEEGVNISKQSRGKSLKNKLNHSKKSHDSNSNQCDTLAYDDKGSKPVLLTTENRVLEENLSKKDGDNIKNQVDVTTAVVVREGPMNMTDVDKKQKNIGVKRTRNQFENITGITQGWTKDQELALERAYLESKPTPHFWKKVSRMVPGKSAQECFDKIHGSHLTPPQPRMRCRARVSNPQNTSFSASKLLNTSSPTTKKPKYRKQKSHIIQRTVRHMLQNQYKAEQNSESDLFSLLEPTFSPSLNLNLMLTTPDRNQEADDARKRCSTAGRSVSRFSGSHGTTLVSPPVLKQVKNKALHEKYIDLLNCREANRKAASAKAGKANKSKVMKQESSAERKEMVKAAKNALVFGAKDAINEFQHQQAKALNDFFDCESGDDAEEDTNQVF